MEILIVFLVMYIVETCFEAPKDITFDEIDKQIQNKTK